MRLIANVKTSLNAFLSPAPLRAALTLLLAALALCASGCGGDAGHGGSAAEPRQATLVLDFVPNGVHAGIYRALAAGYYRAEGIDLRVVQPSSTADTLRLVQAGKADLGIADGIDLGTQVAAGRDVEGVMALLGRPAGGLITLRRDGIASPRQLEGRTVGVTGVPSDSAVLDTVVAAAGGDPGAIDEVTVGFNGVQALAAGRIAAFTGFVPADGARLEREGMPIRAFRLDEWGGPSYPGLVVFSSRERIAAEPGLIRGFVAATIHGYEDTFEDPARSVRDLVAANPGVDPGLEAETLRGYMPLFRGDAPRYGLFVWRNVAALARFMTAHGLAEEPFPPGRYATNRFVAAAPRR